MTDLERLARGLPSHFLREWRKLRGLKLKEVEGLTGISSTHLGRVERGIRPYNQGMLEQLAGAYQCTPHDLIKTHPTAMAGGQEAPQSGAQVRVYTVPVRALEEFAVNEEGGFAFAENGRQSVGFDRDWLGSIIGGPPDDLYALKVTDSSMAPTFQVGDWVIVNRQERDISAGGFFVIQTSGSVTVRRLQPGADPTRVVIAVDQQNSPVFDTPRDEVKVVGRVVWRGGRV